MAAFGKILKFVASPLLGVIGALHHSTKTPEAQSAPLVATRDDAASLAASQDALRRRRGSGADILTGSAGAEAAPGAKIVAGS